MKNILIAIIVLSFFSCSKEELNENIILQSTNWIVEEYTLEAATVPEKPEEEYTLSFDDSKMLLGLDINNCGTSYQSNIPGTIQIGELECTYICCDSEYGTILSELLPKMTKYQGNDDTLILSGDSGEIILKK